MEESKIYDNKRFFDSTKEQKNIKFENQEVASNKKKDVNKNLFDSDDEIEEIIERYADSVRGVCRKYYLVGGNQDDLFQEGMIGFLQAISSFDKSRGGVDSESFKKFALMCARRQILDAIKHENTKKHQLYNNSIPFEINENEVEIPSHKITNPEELYIQKEQTKERLERLICDLSDFEKKVLSLYLEGKTQSSIAVALDKNIKCIDNTIQRIKNKATKEKK